MINNLADFQAQYNLICKPAVTAIKSATETYSLVLENFIKTHLYDEDTFKEKYSDTWINAHENFDCNRDDVTKPMILEFIISDFECELLDHSGYSHS